MSVDFENMRADPAIDTTLFVPAERVRELAFSARFGSEATEDAIREAVRETVRTVRRHRPAALASLPDRTGEPVAAYTIDCVGTEHMSRDVAGIERIAREGSNGPTPIGYFYAAPPDAEQARLREEAETWRIQFVNTAQVRDTLQRDKERLRERVTELEREQEHLTRLLETQSKLKRQNLRRAEAALHPQSAAGEEGK